MTISDFLQGIDADFTVGLIPRLIRRTGGTRQALPRIRMEHPSAHAAAFYTAGDTGARSHLLPRTCQASPIEQGLAYPDPRGSASNTRHGTLYDAYGRSSAYSLRICLAAPTGYETPPRPLDLFPARGYWELRTVRIPFARRCHSATPAPREASHVSQATGPKWEIGRGGTCIHQEVFQPSAGHTFDEGKCVSFHAVLCSWGDSIPFDTFRLLATPIAIRRPQSTATDCHRPQSATVIPSSELPVTSSQFQARRRRSIASRPTASAAAVPGSGMICSRTSLPVPNTPSSAL